MLIVSALRVASVCTLNNKLANQRARIRSVIVKKAVVNEMKMTSHAIYADPNLVSKVFSFHHSRKDLGFSWSLDYLWQATPHQCGLDFVRLGKSVILLVKLTCRQRNASHLVYIFKHRHAKKIYSRLLSFQSFRKTKMQIFHQKIFYSAFRLF